MDKDVGFTQRHANANDRNVANVWNYVDDRMGADDMNGANEGNEDNHVARRYDLPTIPILSAEQADVQVLGTFRVDCSRSLPPKFGCPETTTGSVASSKDRVLAVDTAYRRGSEMQRSTSGCGKPVAIFITENVIIVAACIAWAQWAGIK
jgi:hypothetical protein